jgi:hypothetical protein
VSERYVEQRQRVRRYLARFGQARSGSRHATESEHDQDDMYAFFLNCHHFKDWIKNDPACSAWTPGAEQLVTQSGDLSLCADLCNSLKHLRLDRPRSTQNPAFAQVPVHVIVCTAFTESESVHHQSTAIISTASGLVDGFDLAARCVKVWESYIQANGGRMS